MLKSLRPRRTYPPAKYDAAQKMLLNRPSTMQDVADFVTEYISSDTLGIIATTWLIVADQSALGILDTKCLILSALHSDAVDYPKTGRPVPIDRIPRPDSRLRPDWSAPETARVSDPRRYYVSQRAIGRLYREIDLPAVETIGREEHFQHWDVGESDQASLRKVLEAFRTRESYKCSGAFAAVKERVLDHISIDRHDAALVTEIWDLYKNYASELQTICSDHTLSRGKDAMLTEEEVVVGTIVAQCSQPRKRKDLMSNLREHATALVDAIRGDLAGGIETLPRKSMERAWVALRISMIEEDLFGARSFAWIAMGEIFEVIRNIEASEGLF
ncbi:hypothetical protein PHLCEN_2v11753 [Hermanssonia centrifuga]|uniref:RNA-dependent RNA polymerase n=1 Tax=Hermanssonia centrifuga TaxID=98765 RepID=A0A2R6NJ69_9APHY|nr:hypothetical protein PHLCEN_2v11753 [Hermanssonia centrifuga]